ncbi:MAG TPA: cupin domain-containing protein [Gemmatirosa sp.]
MHSATSVSTARAYVATPDDAPGFWQLGNLWRVMASGIQTDNTFCLLDQLVTPNGGGPCTHTHPMDEGLYVVAGHCTFHAAGQTISAGAGTFVAVPRWTQHAFVVDAPDTQLLNFYLPAGFELLVMGFAYPAERNELPPPDVPMAPRRLVEQLSRDYGQIPILGLPGVDPPRADNMATVPTLDAVVPPFSNHASTAPAYWSVGGLWTVLADGRATNGSYCLFDEIMPHGPAAPPHRHAAMDEVFYVLDGEAEFLLGDRRQTARVGDLVFVPRGTVHGFQVTSPSARFLNLYTPAGFERMLTASGAPAERRELPPPGWTPPAISDQQRDHMFADLGMEPVAVADPFAP